MLIQHLTVVSLHVALVFRTTLAYGRSKASRTEIVLRSLAARMVLTAVMLFRGDLVSW